MKQGEKRKSNNNIIFSATEHSANTSLKSFSPVRRRTNNNKMASHRQSLKTILLFIISICCGFSSFVDADIAVKIERHFPCSPSSGWIFWSFEKSLDGSKKYYVHVETRIGIHGKPERCVNPDKDNCGGIGSCVHCDICKTMGGSLKSFIQIFKGNKPAECSAQGKKYNSSRAEQLWDIFISSRARSGGEIPLVIAARIFDRPINKLSIKELNDALHGSKKGMIG
uniref:Uncharacterized protein n=1 Tax=Meloidogyne hapla TaxID=6305 RepID=A0A1I8AW70_MELHA